MQDFFEKIPANASQLKSKVLHLVEIFDCHIYCYLSIGRGRGKFGTGICLFINRDNGKDVLRLGIGNGKVNWGLVYFPH